MSANGRNPIEPQLELIFRHFNKWFFGNTLPPPSHDIRPEKKFVLRFSPRPLRVIVGGKFATASYETIFAEYLHQMVHIANFVEGNTDCTTNQYHNGIFLATAHRVGLHVSRHKTQGWSITTLEAKDKSENVGPSAESKERLAAAIKSLEFNKAEIRKGCAEISAVVKTRKKTKKFFLKYSCACPPPHNSIRTGRTPQGRNPPRIRCEDCGALFKIAE
jgi:hypothetical protein